MCQFWHIVVRALRIAIRIRNSGRRVSHIGRERMGVSRVHMSVHVRYLGIHGTVSIVRTRSGVPRVIGGDVIVARMLRLLVDVAVLLMWRRQRLCLTR